MRTMCPLHTKGTPLLSHKPGLKKSCVLLCRIPRILVGPASRRSKESRDRRDAGPTSKLGFLQSSCVPFLLFWPDLNNGVTEPATSVGLGFKMLVLQYPVLLSCP